MTNRFNQVADDFSKYRSGYPKKFYQRLFEHHNIKFKNQKVLDVATSNGLAARDLAQLGSIVTGIDQSSKLIFEAQKINQTDSLSIEYLVGDVTQLPFHEPQFNIVTAIHCWQILPRQKTSEEIYRVLLPNGKLIIAQFDPIPIQNNVVSQTEKIIKKYNPDWDKDSRYGMYPEWIKEITLAGFSNIETFTFDHTLTTTHDEWRGRVRTASEVGGSLTKRRLEEFDQELKDYLKKNYIEDTLDIPHRMFAIIAEKEN